METEACQETCITPLLVEEEGDLSPGPIPNLILHLCGAARQESSEAGQGSHPQGANFWSGFGRRDGTEMEQRQDGTRVEPETGRVLQVQ